MPKGTVVSIHVASRAAAVTEEMREAHLVPGKGVEGDRYFNQAGTFSAKSGPDRELTLIEEEALEALRRDHGIEMKAGDARRQVVTRGVALNDLVGRTFLVGGVRLRGIRLCEPCEHLAALTHEQVLRALIHRGGLRAQILSDGVIRRGDAVSEDA